MGQRTKRTTTITVDLGELKAPWQAWCQAHGITPSHALRNAFGRPWTGEARGLLGLGCVSLRNENERPLAWRCISRHLN